ncbi:MAG: caspase family protein [Fimbriimonas ginsengisoli]|uniref:Caspase family protein n=1 Tax=Fimbriimonas ginsengisoli TaxID=1005039 RepID=A0A931LSX3_FIMGI|nr:caspase family protein [Fimbriimonas ginsengisoli]
MTKLRLLCLLSAIFAAASLQAQAWSTAYEDALRNAHSFQWEQARTGFQRAASTRPEDASAPTTLPGKQAWREGAPYSPNFLAAYCVYRRAMLAPGEAQTKLMRTAADEMAVLIDKGQISRETTYYLNALYLRLGQDAQRQALAVKAAKAAGKGDWHVDTEIVDREELALIQAAASPPRARLSGPSVPARAVEQAAPKGNVAVSTFSLPQAADRVTESADKFALVIGSAASRLDELMVPFATDDAQRVRDALVKDAGYPLKNVDLVLNATSKELMASARAMAERVPEGGTVMIYYTGPGVNVDGKDYLVGSEAEEPTALGAMVAKSDIYGLFMAKGARIFAFYQVSRPVSDGRYFGMETPRVGSIAQVQATLPGEAVYAHVNAGKSVGIFTGAFAAVITEMRSNRIPIEEFGWQVFFKIRRGDTGTTGGGSRQTPTLPVLTNMASDARF